MHRSINAHAHATDAAARTILPRHGPLPSRTMPARRLARPHRNATYFFSGSDEPGCLNGNELNIDFA